MKKGSICPGRSFYSDGLTASIQLDILHSSKFHQWVVALTLVLNLTIIQVPTFSMLTKPTTLTMLTMLTILTM